MEKKKKVKDTGIKYIASLKTFSVQSVTDAVISFLASVVSRFVCI